MVKNLSINNADYPNLLCYAGLREIFWKLMLVLILINSFYNNDITYVTITTRTETEFYYT